MGTLDYGKGPNMKNKYYANMSLFSSPILLQKGVPLVNISQFVVKARSIAETFIVENICELPPPALEIKIIGL
jgi:hypothetical protein